MPSKTPENFTIHEISAATQEWVLKAAKKQSKSPNEWAEEALKQAALHTLHPESAQDLSGIAATLKSIDDRLAKLEQSPLHDGARVISEGAKAFSEGARDIYEKVEARKWFDKSYEAASKVCDTVSDQFKTWWETRDGKTTATVDQPIEGEVIKKTENKDKEQG
jgi:hypothetical protein